MPFIIDTGVKERVTVFGYPDGALDHILDALPENPTQSQVDGAVYCHAMAELRKPKMLKTVRAHLVDMWWPLLIPLAANDPASFDALLLEYAEIATTIG